MNHGGKIIFFAMASLITTQLCAQTETSITTTTPAQNPSATTYTTTTTTTTVNHDDTMVAAIYDRFHKNPALIGTSLTVTSLNGIVTIDGTVTAQAQADAAIDDAKNIAGVNSVRSNIRVTTNPDLNKPSPNTNY